MLNEIIKDINFNEEENGIKFTFSKNEGDKKFQPIKLFRNFLQEIYTINDRTFVLLFDIEENKIIARNTNLTDSLFQECICSFGVDEIFDFDKDDVIKKTNGDNVVFVIYNIKSFLKMLDLVSKTDELVTLNLIDIETIKNISLLDNEQNFTSFKKLILTTGDSNSSKINNTFRVSSVSANITRILNELDKDILINNIPSENNLNISFKLDKEKVDYLKEIVNITDSNTGILFDFRLNGDEKLDLYISDNVLNCKFIENVEVDNVVLDTIKNNTNYSFQIIIDKKNMFDFVLSLVDFKEGENLNIDAVISIKDSILTKLVTNYISKNKSNSYYVLTSENKEGI